MENTLTQHIPARAQPKHAEKHQLDTRLADAASQAIRSNRLLVKSKPSQPIGDGQSLDIHDPISPISNPYQEPFVMEAADIESTGAVPVSPYEVLLSDIIRGYEYSPNLAMEFSWAADAQLRLTPAQQSLLEMYFGEQPRPSMATKGEIAEIAKISVEKVTYWFQTRRAKERLRARGHKETGPVDLHHALKAEQFLETEEYKSGLVGYYGHEHSGDDCPSLSSGSAVSSRNPSARSTDYCPSLSSGSTVSSRNPSARSSPGDLSVLTITSELFDLSHIDFAYIDDQKAKRDAGVTPAFARRFKVLQSHLLDRPEKCPIESCEFHVKGFACKADKDRHICKHFDGTFKCGFCSIPRHFIDCDVFLRHLVGAHGACALQDLHAEPENLDQSRLLRNLRMQSAKDQPTLPLEAKCNVCSTTFKPSGMWEHLKGCVIDKVLKNSKAEHPVLQDVQTNTPVNASDCPTSPPMEKSEDTALSISAKPPSSNGYVDRDLPDTSKETVGSLHIGTHPGSCNDIPNSPTTSDEIHSSDEETDCTEELSPSEDEISEVRPVLSPVKQQIVSRLMREFNQQFNSNFVIRTCHGGGSKQPTGTRTPSPLARSGALVGSRKRKGSRGNSPPPPNDGNGEDPNKRRRPDAKSDDTESVMLRFACPYYKRNPRRHQTFTSCRDPGFTTVARLKEHLYRRHLLPIQCNRCCSIFENESQLREHQRDPRGCEIQEQVPLEGFDKAQERKLKSKKRSTVCQTEEDKWKSVYRILFPDDADEDMPSPYCEYITRFKSPDSEKSRNIARFQEFSRLELPRLVRRTLEVAVEKEAQPLEERLKDQLVDIVRECQSQLIAMFQATAETLPAHPPTEKLDETPVKPDVSTEPLVQDAVPDSSAPCYYDLPLVGHSGFDSAVPYPQYDFFGSITTPEKPSPPAMEVPDTDSPDSSSSLDMPEPCLDNQLLPDNEYVDLGKYDNLATQESTFDFDSWPAEWSFEDPSMTMYGGNDGLV